MSMSVWVCIVVLLSFTQSCTIPFLGNNGVAFPREKDEQWQFRAALYPPYQVPVVYQCQHIVS